MIYEHQSLAKQLGCGCGCGCDVPMDFSRETHHWQTCDPPQATSMTRTPSPDGFLRATSCSSQSIPLKHRHLPSGELTVCNGKIHHFSWENPLFLWPFSIANC